MNAPDKRPYESLRQVGLLTTIPFVLLASPVVGYVLGRLIDRWLHTTFMTWVFLALGFVAGIREVIRIVRRAQVESESGDHTE